MQGILPPIFNVITEFHELSVLAIKVIFFLFKIRWFNPLVCCLVSTERSHILKQTDWFLYDKDLHHEGVNSNKNHHDWINLK